MKSNLKKLFIKQGFLKVKNVLDFNNDIRPILNDMEYVMNRLIQKFARNKNKKKALKFNFKKKYTYVSTLKIHDLDQYFNTRLPRDHVKKDSDYFASNSLWNLITNKKILDAVEKIIGSEILSNPVQNTRIKQPEKTLPKDSIQDGLSGRKQENSDEFLVQKKNPLVVPPDFMKLPKPQEEALNAEDMILDEQTDIQKILKVNTDTNNSSEKTFGKAEEFVLENIKK